MAITVIVSVIAYQALDSVISITSSEEKQEEKIKAMSLFFTIFDKDFNHIIPRKVRDPKGSANFEHALIYNKQAKPMLSFTRGGFGNPVPMKLQRSHLQRISYFIEDEKLIRRSFPAVDYYEDTVPQEVTLLEGVKSFTMRFLAANNASQQTNQVASQAGQSQPRGKKQKPWEWVEQWPPKSVVGNQSNPQFNALGQQVTGPAYEGLPMSIEVELEIEGFGKLRRVYEGLGVK
jgi:general secretion pathway protein J